MKILKFSLPNCVPCKVLSKQMEDLDLSNFEVQEVNLFNDTVLGFEYKIKNVPTLVILDGEKEVERVKNITQLKEFLNYNK